MGHLSILCRQNDPALLSVLIQEPESEEQRRSFVALTECLCSSNPECQDCCSFDRIIQ